MAFRKYYFLWVRLWFLVFLCTLPNVSIAANQLEKSQAQLNYIKTELAKNRLVLKDLRDKRVSLLDAIGRLDESLSKLEEEKRHTSASEKELKNAIERLEQEQSSGETELSRLKKRVENRLKGNYVMGQGRIARVLLKADNYTELALRSFMLEQLTQNDISLFKEHDASLKKVKRIRSEKTIALRDMQQTQKTLEEQVSLLKEVRLERSKAIQLVLKDRKLARRRAWELNRRYKALEDLIGALMFEQEKEEVTQLPGIRLLKVRKSLNWPVKGSILHRFGKTKEKKTGATLVSKGLHIKAAVGQEIKSIAAGTVVHVGWLRGFGRIVIINHGESVHSLFAHLSDAMVMAGDQVKKGQSIAKVGDTESMEGPKLYFELRHRGRPQNPLKLLKKNES